jgi:hypothetical protein
MGKTSFRRLWKLATEFAEAFIAVASAVVLAVLGLAGWVTGDSLTAATLLVLSLVAAALIDERSFRVQVSREIGGIGNRLTEITGAVNAIHSGDAYNVLLHEATWDLLEPDGSFASATQLKKIRIDQNKVFALYDLSDGGGEGETEYSPGEAVAEFMGEGRRYRLIALGRIYYRGERLDFTAKRTIREGFLTAQAAVTLEIRDATERARLKILWPEGRPPTALQLGRATPSHQWKNDDVLVDLKVEDGRAVYEVEIFKPEKGDTLLIAWDWGRTRAMGPDALDRR